MAYFRCGAGSEFPDTMDIMTSSGHFDLSDLRTKATRVPKYMFYDNSYIWNVDGETFTIIGSYSFYRCSNIQDIDLPNVNLVNEHAFDCRRTTYKTTVNIDMPKLLTIEANGFYDYCAQNSAKELLFPRLKNIKNYAFGASGNSYAWIVKKMTFGHDDGIVLGTYSFQRAQIETIEVTSLTGTSDFGNHAFSSGSITNLVIRSQNVATLAVGSDLGSSPTNIYVPDSLVNTYKITDGWVNYASVIKPLSEYDNPPEEEAEE